MKDSSRPKILYKDSDLFPCILFSKYMYFGFPISISDDAQYKQFQRYIPEKHGFNLTSGFWNVFQYQVWVNKTNLTLPVPSHKSEWSWICVLGVSILPLYLYFAITFWKCFDDEVIFLFHFTMFKYILQWLPYCISIPWRRKKLI